jgi:TonB family protein
MQATVTAIGAARGGALLLLHFMLALESGAVDAATDTTIDPYSQQVQALAAQGQHHYSQQEFVAAQESYSSAIRMAESRPDLAPMELVEPLQGLARTLIATRQYDSASELLSRAVNIVRRDGGLYDLRQYAALEALIEVDGVLGRTDAAVGNLKYLERISESAYGAGSMQHARALTAVGDGLCRLGEFFAGRQRHRGAIAAIEALHIEEGHSDDVQRVHALVGIARCALSELSQRGIVTSTMPLEGYRGPLVRSASSNPGDVTFRYHLVNQLNYEAESALTRAAALVIRSESIPPELQVATLLQAGDWFQIKDHTSRARGYYLKALRASVAQQVAGADTILSVPVQILYAFPALALPRGGEAAERGKKVARRSVVVDFTVRPNGTPQDAQILRRDASKSMVDETLAAVRNARYRPRFVGEQPVATEHVQFEQSFGDFR